MRPHRFIGAFDFAHPDLIIDDPDLLHQWKRVLRLTVGDRLQLVNDRGQQADVSIVSGTGTTMTVRVNTVQEKRGNTLPTVHLYCSILKKENFELVVQKATEIGIARIVPVVASRTVKLGIRLDRLERIATEAAEQSGRMTIPEIAEITPCNSALSMGKKHYVNYFFDFGGAPIQSVVDRKTDVGIWIGPEGGWDPHERSAAEAAGFLVVSLGELTLRAETAAIVAGYTVIQSTS